jgi:hypothetical protein
MSKAKILVQLDVDHQASVFDAVVAIDAGAEHVLTHAGVQPGQVRDLVHGAIFTRGPQELHNTAIFVGGSSVADGEVILQQVTDSFFGPLRVSVMLDASGANTTAAAAVFAAGRHLPLDQTSRALVLGGTGPVGRRVARLLASNGGHVWVASRSLARARDACDEIIRGGSVTGQLIPAEVQQPDQILALGADFSLVVAAGGPGVTLLPLATRQACRHLRVAIDLNAVPPLGIEGIEAADKAAVQADVVCYGAIAVGGIKMAIHKAAIRQLFARNDCVLDIDAVYALGHDLQSQGAVPPPA